MTDPIRDQVAAIKAATGYTIAEIAERIGVHRLTLQRAMTCGPLALPARRLLWLLAAGHVSAVESAAAGVAA